ncbi:hypothetical protein CSV75_04325 [Sporosarcina sp. P18a]|uniref:hypothetical protein n=1 Tax=Sporosarcina sp. P18a TaxID=2048259 RepID=UPI000C16A06B|nr:hypothetical protein [Sporosarcina sp. P18a]PIC81011.1 hypothetical protein CSV75_04325 [Sporosarcina sp. P18a]
MTEVGDGMYETVKKHSEQIGDLSLGFGIHTERLDNVELSVAALKESDLQHGEQLRQLSSQYTQIQNTIMTENRDTQVMFKDHTEKMYEIVRSSVSFKENAEEREANAEKRKHDYKVMKWKTVVDAATKLILSLTASGGFIYWLIEKAGGN